MTKKEDIIDNYGSDSIQVLEGLEAVRKRPGMYIGATSSRGLHHLVWEIIDNSIDEAMAGYSDDIEVTINKDGSITIKDDGRGIPVDKHATTGKSTVETVYTVLHAGGKFGGGGYKVSGGLHGVGAAVVNALSEYVEIKVYKNGNVYYQKYIDGGKPVDDLKIIDSCSLERTGTTVTFKPDPLIFTESVTFDYEILKQRLRELAFLNKGLRIILEDDRVTDKKDTFLYEGGIREYVEHLNSSRKPIHETIIEIEEELDDIIVDIAMQYNESFTENIHSFVNNITTPEGGTHEDGVRRALTRVLNRYATDNNFIKANDERLIGEDVREGIMMILSVKVADPQFEGQTKTKLGNSEVTSIVDRAFSRSLERFLLENPNEAKIIVEKALAATRARVAAKKARELTRRKGGLELTNQWGKLTDCSSKDASKTEIFIVEGDSAAGSAKDGRDAATQAIMPIRGKILNVEKARLDRILGNEEIRSLITAFGTGIGDEFNIDKLRYHKIIIMTDADVDGAHIRTLLLTFFFRYFKPLVEGGYIYSAQPPLFKITHGKTTKYVLDEQERDDYLATLPETTRYDISRMKGLGEMDAIELRETTMNIGSRTLVRITVEDVILADETFQTLMGEEVEPRRKFIEDNALFVENLDI